MTDPKDNTEQGSPTQTPPPRAPLGDENDSVLALARQLAPHIDTPPDTILTPKNFIERFKFFDDGVDKKLYIWINGVWQALAGASPPVTASVVAGMYLSSTQTISDADVTKVDFDTESFTAEGIVVDTANNTFTVPEDGYYEIQAQVLYAAPPSDTKLIGYIYVNNNPASRTSAVVYNPAAAMFLGVRMSRLLFLSEGDVVDIRIFHNLEPAEPNLDLQAGEEYTFCSIHKR
jgi:hypothetical protein